MKRIHIAHLRASEFFGGPERAILGQATNMPDFRFSYISFVRRGENNRFLDEATSLGLETARLHEKSVGDIRVISQLGRIVREMKIDLVVSHDYKSRVVGHLALRKRSTAHIGHFRGITLEDSKVRIYNWIDRIVMRRMTKILTVSRKSGSLLEGWGVPPKNIQVIPNAIDGGKLLPESYIKQLPSEGPIRIVAAGRLSHEKGYDILFEAISLLVKKGQRNFHVTIYGHGPEETALREQYRRLEIGEFVSLAGFVDDILPILHDSDMLILPSRSEGMPNVILEAWSQKLAVISTAVGGVPEMIDDKSNGWLVKTEKPEAMANALANAIENPQSIIEMGSKGYSTVKERYLFSKQAELLDSVYRTVLENA